MNAIKSIYDWTWVILFFAILIILFVTSIPQTIILYNWASYSVEEVEPIPLTEEETNSFCSNQNCYYTHKVNFDGRDIIFDWHGFHYKDKLWIFSRTEAGRKFIEHYGTFNNKSLTKEDMENIKTIDHVWGSSDKFYKLNNSFIK